MAGDWIKLEAATPDKPEVHQMAEILRMTPEQVLGGLVRLWIWADMQTLNGNGVRVTSVTLDRFSCVTGMANALRQVGWLSGDDNNVKFKNFDRHNGETSKKRALGKRRMKRFRVTHDDDAQSPEKRREEGSSSSAASNKAQSLNRRVSFDSSTRKFAGVVDEDMAAWQSAYPGIAIPLELERAAAWLMADWPARRKVKWASFLVAWFARAQQGSKGRSG